MVLLILPTLYFILSAICLYLVIDFVDGNWEALSTFIVIVIVLGMAISGGLIVGILINQKQTL